MRLGVHGDGVIFCRAKAVEYGREVLVHMGITVVA